MHPALSIVESVPEGTGPQSRIEGCLTVSTQISVVQIDEINVKGSSTLKNISLS